MEEVASLWDGSKGRRFRRFVMMVLGSGGSVEVVFDWGRYLGGGHS